MDIPRGARFARARTARRFDSREVYSFKKLWRGTGGNKGTTLLCYATHREPVAAIEVVLWIQVCIGEDQAARAGSISRVRRPIVAVVAVIS